MGTLLPSPRSHELLVRKGTTKASADLEVRSFRNLRPLLFEELSAMIQDK